jgi:hypothetical protein
MECKCGFKVRSEHHLMNHLRFYSKLPTPELRAKHGAAQQSTK